MGTSSYGKFADQDPYVVSQQVQTSNNNSISLNASLAENNHLRAKNAGLQPDALNMSLINRVPSVTVTAQNTVGAALAGIGQAGTPSENDPNGGGVPCPVLTEYILVRSDANTPIPTIVKYVEVGMYLWSPISHAFEKVIAAEEVENQPLWAVRSEIGVGNLAKGSAYHPIIRSLEDTKGLYLSKCGQNIPCVTVTNGTVREMRGETKIAAVNLNMVGTVKRIETAGPTHIYAAGTHYDLLLAFHNLKPIEGGGGGGIQ